MNEEEAREIIVENERNKGFFRKREGLKIVCECDAGHTYKQSISLYKCVAFPEGINYDKPCSECKKFHWYEEEEGDEELKEKMKERDNG